MIIQLLLDLVYGIVNVLTLPINIPNLPSEVSNIFNTIVEYVGTGLGVISCYTHLSYLVTLFGIVLAVDVGVHLYHFVMFVLRKIPMLSID